MWATIKDHADLVGIGLSSLAGAVWLGKLTNRVTTIENEPKSVTVVMCDERHSSCKELQSSEHRHQKEDFVEIKALIQRVEIRTHEQEKDSIARHMLLVDMLNDISIRGAKDRRES